MEKYKVKLNAPIKTDQEKDGYLAVFGKIQEYSRGEAIKKSKMFNGKIEKVISTKKIFRVYIDIECEHDAETPEHSFEDLALICAENALSERSFDDTFNVVEIKPENDYDIELLEDGQISYDCKKCPKSFLDEKDIQRHVKTHN